MLTIVDAIRLIMHSLKTIIKEGKVSKIWFKFRFQTFPRVPLKRNGQLPNKRSAIIHKVLILINFKITNFTNDRHFSKEKNFLNYS